MEDRLLKEQILRSIFTPCDIALIPKIAPDRQGGSFSFLFLFCFVSFGYVEAVYGDCHHSDRIRAGQMERRILGLLVACLCTRKHDFFTPNHVFHFL